MPNLVIENFLKMNPQIPQFSRSNMNYLLAGVDPLYYLSDNSQEEQIAPLAASVDWTQITGTISGNVTHMVASVGGPYTTYCVTDKGKVYGLTTTTINDLGFPTGAQVNNAAWYLTIAANQLYATYGSGGSIYYMSLPSGVWASVSGLNTATGTHLMEQFSDRIAVTDGTVSYSQNNLVRLIDPTSGTPVLLTTPQLNAGLGFGIMQMRNYNDKYLAIAVGKVATGSIVNGYPQNYLYLWDGAYPSFNYSVKIPGQFIDMKVVNSVLYVAVQVSANKTCVFYLSGTKLRKVFTTQISTIAYTQGSAIPCPLFDYKNYLGVHLNTNTDLTHPLMVYGSDEVGDIEFIQSSGRRFDQFVVDYNGVLIGNKYVPGGDTELFYLPSTGTNYQNILYKSQWMPIRNLKALEIWYETPPQSGSDAINVTIYGKGENIIAGSQVIALGTITPSTALSNQMTLLDVEAFNGDQLSIVLTTTNTTWRPIIRQIVPITE